MTHLLQSERGRREPSLIIDKLLSISEFFSKSFEAGCSSETTYVSAANIKAFSSERVKNISHTRRQMILIEA